MVINKANTALIAKLPYVRAGDQKALDIYLDLLSTIVSSLIKTGAKHELYSSMLMDSVLDKLPMNTKNEWGRHVMSKIQRPNVVMLRDWLTDQALANKKNPESPLQHYKKNRDLTIETDHLDCPDDSNGRRLKLYRQKNQFVHDVRRTTTSKIAVNSRT